jgi:outer membrane protein OmpA-like peptidoglycan-associated protein
MSFRNWLLTGTSLTLLAFAPLSMARAQDATDPALVAAYQAFQADQSEANQTALTEACIAAGFANLDECIAALAGQTPVEQAPPESSAEATPSEEAPPAEEQPPVEQPVSSEPPVTEPPASSEAPVTEQPVSSEAPPAQETTEQPPAEQAVSSEPAPPASSEAAPPSSEAAPVSSEAPPADQGNDAVAQLTAAVELYNQGVAELTAGDPNGQAKIDEATAQMNALCTPAGYPDIQTCVAQFGLTLNPLPAAGDQPPATSSEQPATSEEPVVGGDQPVTDEATEVLPEGVPPEEAAPILDSEKDDTAPPADQGTTEQPAPDQPSSEQPSQEQPAPAEPVAPPENDQAAQQDIQPPPPEEQSAATGEGEAAGDFQFGFADDQQPDGGFAIPDQDDGEQIEVVQAPSANNPSFVFKIGIHIYITNVQRERDRFYDRDRDEIYYERLDNGRIREVITRPDGTRIITVYNRYGDVLKRTKIYPDNREFYLATYDPRDDDDGFFIDPGDELPPLRLTISAREYILDADAADEEEVEFFLSQPPVERITRIYSIDEVKRSARVRDIARRIDLDTLNFEFGSASIPETEVQKLEGVASAMEKLLEKNPAETFLIEGHTDAVGKPEANLALSDRRAEAVAEALSNAFSIPPENLTTQGYGEEYLKVDTSEPERENRRVAIRRITSLVAPVASAN